jgi:hypothetical protein
VCSRDLRVKRHALSLNIMRDEMADTPPPGITQKDVNSMVALISGAALPGSAGDVYRERTLKILGEGSMKLNDLIATIVSNPRAYGIEGELPESFVKAVGEATGSRILQPPTEEEEREFRKFRPLIRELYGASLIDNPQMRSEAMQYVSVIRALPQLRAQLNSDDPGVRKAAADEFEELNARFHTDFQRISDREAEVIVDALDHPEKYNLRAVTPKRPRGRPPERPAPVGRPRQISETVQSLVTTANTYKRTSPVLYKDWLEAYKAAYTNPQLSEHLRRSIGEALVILGEAVPPVTIPASGTAPAAAATEKAKAEAPTPPPPEEEVAQEVVEQSRTENPAATQEYLRKQFSVEVLSDPEIESSIHLYYLQLLVGHPEIRPVEQAAGPPYWNELVALMRDGTLALPPVETLYVFHQACAVGNLKVCTFYKFGIRDLIMRAVQGEAGETDKQKKDYAGHVIRILEMLHEQVPDNLRAVAGQ